MTLSEAEGLIADWARSKPLIRRVFLFGSRVRGEEKPDSDLDIAVELDPEYFPAPDESGGIATWMFETTGWKDELQSIVPFAVDLEQLCPGETPTIESALQQSSRLVYEKKV
jgi:predicted nucleotidyltransferase